jgi:hypothetical protein
MLRYIYSILFLVVLFLIPFASVSAQSTFSGTATPKNDWEKTLQNLLETHGLLLNQIIVAASTGKSKNDLDSIKKKLLENAHNLADFFDAHVGEQAGKEFEPLFDDHIKYGGDYIMAVKDHKPTDQSTQQALQNGRQIADLFSKWFPSIPRNDWQKILADHVKIEAQQTDDYFKKDMRQAAKSKDDSLVILNKLGDMLIQGINSKESS